MRRAARISSARAGNKTREALYSQRRVKHRLERATSSLFHVERPVRLCKRDLAISRPTPCSSTLRHASSLLPCLIVSINLQTRQKSAGIFHFDWKLERIRKTMTMMDEVKKFPSHEGKKVKENPMAKSGG